MTSKREIKYAPIPIEWIEQKALSYILSKDRKFTSADLAIVYSLIGDWREEQRSKNEGLHKRTN